MASPISYRNLVTAGMLWSPNDFSAPLDNALTRQLSEQAISTLTPDASDDEAIVLNVDLGSSAPYFGCVAILGCNLQQMGDTVVTLLCSNVSAGASDVYTQTDTLSSIYLSKVGTPHHAMFFNQIQARYVQIRVIGGTSVLKIGRVWVGPVFGQAPSGNTLLAAVPNIQDGWELFFGDPAQNSYSRGKQGHARPETRARSLRCRHDPGDMKDGNATGRLDFGTDWQQICEADQGEPMLVCARTEHPIVDDMLTLHRHLVYGALASPLSLRNVGADAYDNDLFFKGEN